MELGYFINLVLIFALNVLFFFLGICLNSCVVISFWRSAQLRKKLCFFMIMVLSYCDLLAVLTNHPVVAVVAMLWLTGRLAAHVVITKIPFSLGHIFLGVSFLAILVMNFDRYLAISYPLYHRTSVTKGRLFSLHTTQSVLATVLALMSVKGSVISNNVFVLICFVILVPPMVFINWKLLSAVRRCSKSNRITPKNNRMFGVKRLSSCLLAVACFVVMTIPVLAYVVLRATSKERTFSLDEAHLVGLWAKTLSTMNSTFNCLIFYWKNKILRIEGMKLVKGMNRRRRLRYEQAEL